MTLRPPRHRWLAFGLLAVSSAQAQVFTLTEDSGGTDRVALGYPVPIPADTQTAFDGFRSYAALDARLSDLSLLSADIRADVLGQTRAERGIPVYLLGDADTSTAEGFAESAALINGGIHAREWASPEVVVNLIETMAAQADEPGLVRYLLDSVNVVVIPVLNVDGFLQTQRYPDTFLQSEYAGDPTPQQLGGDPYPRDGRFRRKNMLDVDEALCAAGTAGCAVADGMFGVDLNRNNTPYWASGNQNSGEPAHILYRGSTARSEPEIQALEAAAALAPASRLRLFVDVHSFSRLYYGVNTGNNRRDSLARSLAERMSAATTGNAARYPYSPSASGYGIGSTDERFGYGYQIPAYTLEIEPSANGGLDYGSNGYHHDGFVLPDAEIARVREELTRANLIGLYRMAGPPALIAARLRRTDTDTVVYEAAWNRSGNARTLTETRTASLEAGIPYRLWLAFNKPMRTRGADGAIEQFTGQTPALSPTITLEGIDADNATFEIALETSVDGWRQDLSGSDGALRYADDAFAVDFTLPEAPLLEARRIAIAVSASDMSGQALDTDPASVVDWSAGWSGYNDNNGNPNTDTGGTDRQLRLVDDPTLNDADGGRGGGGGLPPGLLLTLLGLRVLRAWWR